MQQQRGDQRSSPGFSGQVRATEHRRKTPLNGNLWQRRKAGGKTRSNAAKQRFSRERREPRHFFGAPGVWTGAELHVPPIVRPVVEFYAELYHEASCSKSLWFQPRWLRGQPQPFSASV